MSRRLRIAVLCHSVKPRGSVVHALELAGALAALGHAPTVHAPDPESAGFFRATGFDSVSVPARRGSADLADMVETRAADYVAYFDADVCDRFDVFHAQDGISGNALATLKTEGRIGGFVRTVHHVDAFEEPRVAELQLRAIATADELLTVSPTWRDRLRADVGLSSTVVGNGVDLVRYSIVPDESDSALRLKLGLLGGPIVLAVGGIERRKNTVRTLEAFRQVRRLIPSAQLVIAGGASLLDHSDYHSTFAHDLVESGLPRESVVLAGTIADADMPALFRLADALAFPSVTEGFGLVVLEAMASGAPAIVSRIQPFTDYLGDDDVAWCDPLNAGSIANALMAALSDPLRSRLIERGLERVAGHGWDAVARAHLPVYQRLAEIALA